MSNPSHKWSFYRTGGFDQVVIGTGADLKNLDLLDQKLWCALACPTEGLELDPITLKLMDADHDGRIRAPELIAVCKWATSLVKNPDNLLTGVDGLPLNSIDDSTEEGAQILASARRILHDLGKGDAAEITVADTSDTVRIFSQTVLNGDGVVLPESTAEPELQQVIQEILDISGGVTDRSGKIGINRALVASFYEELAAYESWIAASEVKRATIFNLGDATEAGYNAVEAVRLKVDDFFGRCRLAAFDTRAQSSINRDEKDFAEIARHDVSLHVDALRDFPLSHAAAGKALPLTAGCNPAWTAEISRFRSDAVAKVLGEKMSLSEAEWLRLRSEFAGYAEWISAKPLGNVSKLGIERVRQLLGNSAHEAILALIAQDEALEPEANAIASVDRLVRYQRDLGPLVRNFVNFADLYGAKVPAIFQAGTLYLDTRSCNLCIRVNDAPKHGLMAGLSRCYLAYCDCVRKSTGEKIAIVAAFTDGDSDNLMVGRNGVFYDRQGRDWDATITKLVENPISIRQAFWSPYKRFVRFLEEQAAKRAAAADEAASSKLVGAAETTQLAATSGRLDAKPKFDTGLLATLAIASAGVGAMLGGIIGAFLGLGVWMPIGVVGILLLISGPSMILAWLKLRQRNLGPILDANGWAVNARARINIRFGRSLTRTAILPPGASHSLNDPFAEKKNPWPLRLLILIAIAAIGAVYATGKIDRWLPDPAKKSTLFPAKEVPTPPATDAEGAQPEA